MTRRQRLAEALVLHHAAVTRGPDAFDLGSAKAIDMHAAPDRDAAVGDGPVIDAPAHARHGEITRQRGAVRQFHALHPAIAFDRAGRVGKMHRNPVMSKQFDGESARGLAGKGVKGQGVFNDPVDLKIQSAKRCRNLGPEQPAADNHHTPAVLLNGPRNARAQLLGVGQRPQVVQPGHARARHLKRRRQRAVRQHALLELQGRAVIQRRPASICVDDRNTPAGYQANVLLGEPADRLLNQLRFADLAAQKRL